MRHPLSQIAQSGATDGDSIVWSDADDEFIPGSGGGGGHTIAEEGTPLTARATLNFVGAAVTATDDPGNDQTDVTIVVYQILPYSYTGTLTVQTGTFRLYVERASTIVSVRASVGTAPTGAAILVDVNKNGTTIFTTQSNRPSIAVSTNTATAAAINVTSLAAGDYLTVDIDQIGSTVAGANLTVVVEVSA